MFLEQHDSSSIASDKNIDLGQSLLKERQIQMLRNTLVISYTLIIEHQSQDHLHKKKK